jgi:hypothetical protein
VRWTAWGLALQPELAGIAKVSVVKPVEEAENDLPEMLVTLPFGKPLGST